MAKLNITDLALDDPATRKVRGTRRFSALHLRTIGHTHRVGQYRRECRNTDATHFGRLQRKSHTARPQVYCRIVPIQRRRASQSHYHTGSMRGGQAAGCRTRPTEDSEQRQRHLRLYAPHHVRPATRGESHTVAQPTVANIRFTLNEPRRHNRHCG